MDICIARDGIDLGTTVIGEPWGLPANSIAPLLRRQREAPTQISYRRNTGCPRGCIPQEDFDTRDENVVRVSANGLLALVDIHDHVTAHQPGIGADAWQTQAKELTELTGQRNV